MCVFLRWNTAMENAGNLLKSNISEMHFICLPTYFPSVTYCAQYSDFTAKKCLSMTPVAPVPYKIFIWNFWVSLLANILTTLGHREGLVQPKCQCCHPPSCRPEPHDFLSSEEHTSFTISYIQTAVCLVIRQMKTKQ